MVSPEIAAGEKKWWYDERYAIYDLSVNSAIVYPQHNESVQLSSSSTYNVRGYAYGGGGRRINRIELSLDKGSSELFFNRENIPWVSQLTIPLFSLEIGRYRLSRG